MASNRYSIYPATFKTAAPATFDLRQMENYGFSPNAQKAPYTPGGALDRGHVGLAWAYPMHRFGTRDLDTIFNTMGVSPILGLAIDGANPAATFRYQERKCEGGFESGATHINRTAIKGFLKPMTLSASATDRDGALLNMEFYSLSDDQVNEPDDKADGIDFATAPTPLFNSRYFFGPIYLGAVKQPGFESINFDFGLNCNSKTFDLVFPDCASIISRDPMLTFTGPNMAMDEALSSFANDTGAAISVYLRKGVHGGGRVADGTGAHVKITIATGEWSVDDESVSHPDDATMTFAVMPTGTITLTTTSTVP